MELVEILNAFSMIVLGSFIGMLFGAIPGLGAALTIVLLLPITYFMSPLAAILLLLSAYQSAEYGGSISALTLGIPGTPAAAATVIDGFEYAKSTSPGKAISFSLMASSIGGIFGSMMLIFLSKPLTVLALKMSAPEYFLVGTLGLFAIATLASKDILKSAISAILGLLAATIGMDLFTGAHRFTFGRVELLEGIGMIVLIVGVFGFSEIFNIISVSLKNQGQTTKEMLKSKITFKEFKSVGKHIGLGSIVGSLVGAFPGTGAGTASFFSYSIGKKFSKSSPEYGKGNPEGIVAPEAANNATVGGALLPLLTLGIPGSATVAIIMGAFVIHGIQPGPKVFETNAALVNGIIWGFLIAAIVMFFVGKLLTPFFARILVVPNKFLVPILLVVSTMGVFTNNKLFFDIWVALGLGIIAFLFKKLDYSLPSFVLAFILSPIIEENFRRSLSMSSGSYTIFFSSIFSKILILSIIVIIFFGVKGSLKGKKKKTQQ